MHRAAASAAVFALFVAIGVASATAAFPGANGRIVFQTNRDSNFEVYTMDADGTNRVNLTRNAAGDRNPRWSADGSRIAFVSDRDVNPEIFTMNVVGSDVRQVTTTTGVANLWPSWTNDGRILFHRGPFGSRDVYLVNADGSGETNLTPDAVDSAWAAGAPHGPWIVLSRLNASPGEGQRLYRLNLATGFTKRVTAGTDASADFQANWSPSGNDLVFARSTAAGSDLYLVHADGTELRRLTDTPARDESQPAFSPDGTKVVFHGCSGLGTPEQRCANYVIGRDGAGEVEISMPTVPYVDTFTSDRLDPFWHTVLLGTGSRLAQTGGRLLETFDADAAQGPPFDNIDAHVGTNCKLTGDFDVQADFELRDWPGANGVQVTLSAFEPGEQVLRESQVWGEQYAAWIPPTFTAVPTADVSGSLRSVRSGTTATGYYRRGGSWVQIASGTTSSADATIGLEMSSFLNRFAQRRVEVAWDNFRISSGTLRCPTWWDDSSPDWQAVGS